MTLQAKITEVQRRINEARRIGADTTRLLSIMDRLDAQRFANIGTN